MTLILILALCGVSLFAAALLLLAGLCRAAADLRDVEPDNGEYHE